MSAWQIARTLPCLAAGLVLLPYTEVSRTKHSFAFVATSFVSRAICFFALAIACHYAVDAWALLLSFAPVSASIARYLYHVPSLSVLAFLVAVRQTRKIAVITWTILPLEREFSSWRSAPMLEFPEAWYGLVLFATIFAALTWIVPSFVEAIGGEERVPRPPGVWRQAAIIAAGACALCGLTALFEGQSGKGLAAVQTPNLLDDYRAKWTVEELLQAPKPPFGWARRNSRSMLYIP